MQSLQSQAEQLAPLQDLSGLRTLSLTTPAEQSKQLLQVVASLAGLRQLGLCVLGDSDQLVLLQVTRLKHLTGLSYDGHLSGALTRLELSSKVSLKPCMAYRMPLWHDDHCVRKPQSQVSAFGQHSLCHVMHLFVVTLNDIHRSLHNTCFCCCCLGLCRTLVMSLCGAKCYATTWTIRIMQWHSRPRQHWQSHRCCRNSLL
jgi:hypothetical protein